MNSLENIAHELALEYIRKTENLDVSSKPDEYAKEYYAAFDVIADELLRLDAQKR